MTRWTFVALLTGIALAISACADDGQRREQSDQSEEPGPTAEEESADEANGSAPEDLFGEEIGRFDSRPILPWYMHPPVFHAATDQDELETGREMYQLDGDLPDVDWDDHAVLLLGLSESGSCPWEFEGFSFEGDDLISYLDYDLEYSEDDMVECTGDDNRRTFLVQVDRERVPGSEPIVRLAHSNFDHFPMQTDTRDIPLKPIDATRHDYPFEVWRSESTNGQEPGERVIDRADIIAHDESTIDLRFGFSDSTMIPDLDDSREFEFALPDDSYVFTRIGMIVHDASLGFELSENREVYTAPYREVAVAGRDYHEMMARPMININPHYGNADDIAHAEIAISLEGDPEQYEWDVVIDQDAAIVEMSITRVE